MARSVMQHSFQQVPRANIPRSSFNRSHGHKTTFDADWLVPIYLDEVMPGDTFNMSCTSFVRLATPLHPIMDNLSLDIFFFFIPNRLVWTNWEKFCGAQDKPGDSIDFSIPGASLDNAENWRNFRLCDYFGLPYTTSGDSTEISALPFRSYLLVWNEWFRDQNLQDSLEFDLDDTSPADLSEYPLQKRGKRHDYFTSALPWPQKGTAVSLPLGTSAPVMGIGKPDAATWNTGSVNVDESGGVDTTYTVYRDASASTMYIEGTGSGAATDYPNIFADLSNATAATINDLRESFQIQRLLERDARSGTRYNETILAHFGVTVPDFRVQRPEFLGGGSTRINITPVANTSEDATSKQGDLTGFGTGSGTHGFVKSFTEHGILLGLANVRSDITYSQGIDRMFSRSTRYDFYYPVLSQLGEQPIYNREIYYQNAGVDDNVFGYTERYNEYRYKPSRITGQFRPDHATSLEAWHLSEEFLSLPSLGATFIESNTGTPLDRAIAVPSEPQFIGDFYFELRCARPMPIHGVPGNLDHF